DQPRDEHGFARIAERIGCGNPDVSAAHQMGNDRSNYRAASNGYSRITPDRDQDARRQAPGKPEQGKAIGFSEHREAQPCREKIGDAERNGEPDRTNQALHWVGASFVVKFSGKTLRHMRPKSLKRSSRIPIVPAAWTAVNLETAGDARLFRPRNPSAPCGRHVGWCPMASLSRQR